MPKRPTRSAKQEREHLLAILHAPDDSAPALAYADWLDALGDLTGELIRLRLERHALDPAASRRAEISTREQQLLTEPKIGEYTMAGEDVFLYALRRLGGTVIIDQERILRELWIKGDMIATATLARLAAYPTLRRVRAEDHPLTRDEIAALTRLTQIEDLGLDQTGLTDETLALLGALSRLKVLSIAYNPIEGAGLTRLVGLSQLENLDLQRLEPPRKGRKDAPRDSAWLAPLESFPRMKWLDLSYNGLTGAGLVHLKPLVALEILELQGNKFDDAALAPLAHLTALRYLDLDGNEIAAAGIAHLRGLVNLERLSLRNRAVGDAGMAHLAGLTRLQELNLCHLSVPITDEGARHLQGLTALEELELSNNQLTDAALAYFAGMQKLRSLNLSGNAGITGPGLAHLAMLPNLTDLDLCSTDVSDKALPQLKALTHLENLGLNQARVSARGMAALQKALPDASVFGSAARH